ncbi:MAG: response regulator [Acidobacteriota bacterium]|nr:response regulator [Acidobacteriota bacterium]
MKTVLVVDDDPEVLQYTAMTLNRGGIHAIGASSGEEALRTYGKRKREIKLVLTDIIMPQSTGIELALAILAYDPKIPIVYMTGYKTDHKEQFGPALEGHELLGKPFTPEELLSVVRRALHITVPIERAAATD